MTRTAFTEAYSERTTRLLYYGAFVALGLAVGGVFVVAGEAAGAVALVALVVLGNVAGRQYSPVTVDERDEYVHRAASARTVEVVGVVGGLLVAGAVVLDAFDVYARPEWAMPLGWAVAVLYLVYGGMRLYERYY
ncbi:MAG: DUF2178 domain-containing protein [Haloarculaceae archaeon]